MLHRQVPLPTRNPTAVSRITRPAVVLAVLSLASALGFTYLGGEVGEPITTVTDTHLLQDVAGWTRLWPFALAATATFFGSAPAIIGITLVMIGLVAWQKRRSDVIYLIVAGIGAIVLSTWTKDLVARMRPIAFFRTAATGYSFPSGHTLNSTSLALAIGFILWRTSFRRAMKVIGSVVLAIYVVCVGTSRIVLGVHYPSDVLGGFLLAVAWGTLLMIFVLVLERRNTSSRETLADAAIVQPESKWHEQASS